VADLELRYLRMTVLPPIGKQSRFPALQLSVIHARERNALRKGAPHVRNVLKLARLGPQSGSCQRSSSWQHGDVARHDKTDGHPTRLRTRNEKM
jgi:hypothetical protein